MPTSKTRIAAAPAVGPTLPSIGRTLEEQLHDVAVATLEHTVWWAAATLVGWAAAVILLLGAPWPSRAVLAALALACATVIATQGWRLRRKATEPSAGHRHLTTLAALMAVNGVAAATLNPELGALLCAAAVIWAGCLLYTRSGLAVVAAVVGVGWAAAAASNGIGDWQFHGFFVLGGIAFAGSVLALRLQACRKLSVCHHAQLQSLDRRYRETLQEQTNLARAGQRATEDLRKRGETEGLWDWDLDSDRMTYSPYWRRMLGYAIDEVENSPEGWFNLIHAHDLARVIESLTAHLEGKTGVFESEHRIRQADKQYCWVLSRGQAIFNPKGKALRVVGTQINLRRLKSFESKLLHDATHDRLTGLPNRQYLLARLREDVSRSQRSPEYRFAVVFVDLDGFKDVNDSLGHLAGDKMLSEIGARLARCRQDGDTVARLGGDEFVLLVRNIRSEQEAVIRAQLVQKAVAAPFRAGRQEVVMACSIGVAMNSNDFYRPEDLLRNADLAMYRAKSQNKGEIQVFDAEMHTRTARLWTLQNDLRKAIERRELELVYQPLIALADDTIVGAEALIRWRRSDGEVVSPSEFIPLAEEQGLIWEIGEWVLREACRQNKQWQSAGRRPIKMSVNLSARQLANREFGNTVKRVLHETRLDARWLQLELTETALMGSLDATPASLYSLFCMGIQTAIDDFGTGYSSLDYLRRLQFDTLKIDKSFVCDITTDRRAAALAQSMISMAHSLSLSVVAEGVETAEQLAILHAYGCDAIQGYLASRPVSAATFTDMLGRDVRLLARALGRAGATELPAADARIAG